MFVLSAYSSHIHCLVSVVLGLSLFFSLFFSSLTFSLLVSEVRFPLFSFLSQSYSSLFCISLSFSEFSTSLSLSLTHTFLLLQPLFFIRLLLSSPSFILHLVFFRPSFTLPLTLSISLSLSHTLFFSSNHSFSFAYFFPPPPSSCISSSSSDSLLLPLSRSLALLFVLFCLHILSVYSLSLFFFFRPPTSLLFPLLISFLFPSFLSFSLLLFSHCCCPPLSISLSFLSHFSLVHLYTPTYLSIYLYLSIYPIYLSI
ncbi:unnamed protein product [Acanthosepion pharaonis]|uniref:Uncharacterized protein n=1 Tax=Acanthosepion pharaonis TaxID=158019 RepID=A0A812DLA4_ACAPH|nr:unnamed protein product [Sepia pharaonis]